jgi:hypothetical protein
MFPENGCVNEDFDLPRYRKEAIALRTIGTRVAGGTVPSITVAKS